MEPIKLQFENQILTINPTGGGIMEYYQIINNKRLDIIYGYADIEKKVGSMGDVLFPFPGRVENSEYNFAGKRYKLSNVKIKDGHAIHGFVKNKEWQIDTQVQDQIKLSCELKEEEYGASGYPFSVKIILTYLLGEDGLTCRAEVRNIGENDAPIGLGFHPYFTVGTETIDDMELNIRAKKLVEFDSGLKPTGELLNVVGSNLNFDGGQKIGDRIIDNCYTNLKYEKTSTDLIHRLDTDETRQIRIAKTIISDNKNRRITIWQDDSFPYLQVYSADTIGDQHRRKGFAIEPQTCTGFAFNVEGMGLKILQPRAVFIGNWGINAN